MVVDPERFGALTAEVAGLRRDLEAQNAEIAELRKEIARLVAIAERSKGAIWAAMAFAGVLSSVATWAVQHWLGGNGGPHP